MDVKPHSWACITKLSVDSIEVNTMPIEDREEFAQWLRSGGSELEKGHEASREFHRILKDFKRILEVLREQRTESR